ncbi:MAG: signal recognition particle-docking protein FtsY [Candidatus Binatia bacterium]
MEDQGFFHRLMKGLTRTRQGWGQQLGALFLRPGGNEEVMRDMEEILITSDVGVQATQKLLNAMRQQVLQGWENNPEEFSSRLQNEIVRILMEPVGLAKAPLRLSVRPWIVMLIGVNGVGKTTTIGKLADRYRRDGKRVLLVAADTFRAAAIEQLEIWGARVGSEVIKHQPGQDPSGVVFDAVHAARKRGADVVLIDTAGRLHTKTPLLEELKKMRRVIGKELAGAPHEVLLVLDATIGQNALQQAKVFKEALEVTGIVLTKLDGTAKGGVVVGIQEELKIPVEYIGIGEGVEDLHPFDPTGFVRAIFV